MKKTRKYLLLSLLLLIVILCMAIAACNKTTAELSFDTMGGEDIENVTLDIGIEYTLPTPVREGYSFEGWYISKDYSGESVAAITVENNAQFYAKWEKLPVITLELGTGGTIEGVNGGKLYLKAGANIYSYMENFTPTREGYQFDVWYAGDSALPITATMPAEGITLTARYKVGYTVEAYLQTIGLDGYERGEDIKGFAPTGAKYTPSVTVYGFYTVKNANAVTELTLSDNPSENVYKFYFDREDFFVTLRSNYPNSVGKPEETQTFTKYYGAEFELADDAFSAEGCCLLGWSTSANGEVEYEASYIANRLYKGQSAEPVTFVIDKDIILYAVWNKGSTDVFGGTDYIYVIEAEHTAYLERGGVFFKGDYNANRGTFDFRDVRLSGRLNEDGTFVYYDEDRASGSAMLYVIGTGVDVT
ncbi:MAG: InlB B-repeat-containing protein, partial [Clostridiales bacterium]|nr:InlB B-repeat-containing protein [Clostridiales bacterium]